MSLTTKQTIKGTVNAKQTVKGKMLAPATLDETLTKEGFAADSKAVGDALGKKAVGKAYISNNKDLNAVTESGMYRLGGSLVNAPSGASYGQLLVIHGGGDSIAQLVFDFTMARMWVRTGAPADVGGAGTWTEWAQCYTTAKKPTAADVGARPNTWMPTASQVGARPDTWMPTAEQVGARPDTWMPTASDVGAHPNTWLPTLAQIGAAPAGYGLGTQNQSKVTTLEQLDNMGHSGWYDVQLSTEKIKNYIKGTLCINAGYHVIEQVFAPWTQNFKLIRYWDYEYGWSEWAYDSPPMLLGEEYRTTERWNGKAVYTKLVGTGQLPNNSVLSLTDCYTATNIVRALGATNDGSRMSFPAKWQEWDSASSTMITKEIGLMVASWGASIFTNYDASSVNATIQIWYTKD